MDVKWPARSQRDGFINFIPSKHCLLLAHVKVPVLDSFIYKKHNAGKSFELRSNDVVGSVTVVGLE